jgi:crotonobetainyl-CoA:carnitine CoA-transferase CaiB-like acyl-CoA transferase
MQTILADKLTACHAAQAITSGLLARALGKGGQAVKLSMLGVALSFLWPDCATTEQILAEDADIRPSAAAICRMYRFKNGWGVFQASDTAFVPMCAALNAALGADERLHTRLGRFAHPELMAQVEQQWREAVAEMDVDEGIALLESLDVPCAKVMSLAELPQHPQVVANDLFTLTDHPVMGPVREARHPIAFSGTPAEVGGPAPALGRDTDDILGEIGLGPDEIAGLRARGVVA